MKCRDCKWCYTNETMDFGLYICVNGHSENFGEYTGLGCEDDCEDGEEDWVTINCSIYSCDISQNRRRVVSTAGREDI